MDIQHYMQTLGRQARAASRVLAAASTAAKNAALIAMAGEIRARRAELLAANAQDLEEARAARTQQIVRNSFHPYRRVSHARFRYVVIGQSDAGCV